MEPLSDSGFVSLGLCPATRRPLLCHRVTGEVVAAPADAICSSLAFVDGVGQFRCGSQIAPVVVSDHLRLTPTWDAESSHWLVVDSAAEDVATLTDSLSKRRELQVPISVMGVGDAAIVTAWIFARRLAGAYLFWSLPKLWVVIRPATLGPSSSKEILWQRSRFDLCLCPL